LLLIYSVVLLLTARAKKILVIKNLPLTTTEEEVKALSPDLQKLMLEATKNTGDKKTKYVCDMFFPLLF